MTRDETVRVLAVLAAVWPTREITDATIVAYQTAWADIPYAVVNAAATSWLREGKFFPAPSEIRHLCARGVLALDAPEEAWGEVQRAIRAVGWYGSPVWSSPELARTVEALGWKAICVTELDAVPTLRAHFYRTYQAYRERTEREADLAALPGAKGRQSALTGAGRQSASEGERYWLGRWAGKAETNRALAEGGEMALPGTDGEMPAIARPARQTNV